MTIRMTRTVAFSSGHRYWFPQLDGDSNRRLFGPWASPYSHGHNYVLHVTVEGPVDPVTGMVVNIKRVDDELQRTIVKQFDGKSINDEIAEFAERAPCVENLMLHIRDCLLQSRSDRLFTVARTIGGVNDTSVRLVQIKLEETPLFYGELDTDKNLMTLTRVYEFAASHRLNAAHLPPEENLALYGKCNNAAGHGHNYVLEVTVAGQPDPVTGMLVDLDALDVAVEQQVLSRYDHKNLDVDVPELSGKITTSEVVAQTIFGQLDGRLPATLSRVRLFETARNAFEVSRP
jgi:6-pyruvoyltetrahydropterin/6-carboxytetrahydropterin synthase